MILSKLLWAKEGGSELQKRDVRRMLQLGQPLDRDYLDRWAASLSVAALLEESSR